MKAETLLNPSLEVTKDERGEIRSLHKFVRNTGDTLRVLSAWLGKEELKENLTSAPLLSCAHKSHSNRLSMHDKQEQVEPK